MTEPLKNAATQTAVTPASIAALIKFFLTVEPTALTVLQTIYGSNPAFAAAIAIFPTIQPVLTELETLLESLPTS